MPKAPLIAATIVAGSFVVLGTFAVVMMAAMMGNGHWGMMGGRGSDPDDETPVVDVTQVRIEDFAFAPANIVIDAGTTVTWTNNDSARHTVTSDDGDELDSELFGRGETYRYTFDTPGAYAYHCKPHPYMKGLVTVRTADGATIPDSP